MVNIQGNSGLNQYQVQQPPQNTFQPYQVQGTASTIFTPNDIYNPNPLLSSDPEKNKVASSSKKFFGFFSNVFNKIGNALGMSSFSSSVKNQFSIMDLNKDNNLSTTEFNSVSSLIKQSFQQVDKNSDQKVSLGEYKKAVSNYVESEFKLADKNNDGFINFNEAAMSGNIGNKQFQLQIDGTHVEYQFQVNEEMFKQHDANQDGLLSKEEFTNLLMDQINNQLSGRVANPQFQIQIN